MDRIGIIRLIVGQLDFASVRRACPYAVEKGMWIKAINTSERSLRYVNLEFLVMVRFIHYFLKGQNC